MSKAFPSTFLRFAVQSTPLRPIPEGKESCCGMRYGIPGPRLFPAVPALPAIHSVRPHWPHGPGHPFPPHHQQKANAGCRPCPGGPAPTIPLYTSILPMRQIFSVPLPPERLIHVLLHEYSVFMGIKPSGPVHHRNRDSFLSLPYHPGLRKQSSGLLPHLSALRHNLDGRAYFNGFEKGHAGRTGHADASMGLRRHENGAHMHADAAVRQPHEVGHGSII